MQRYSELLYWRKCKKYLVKDKEKQIVYLTKDAPERARQSMKAWIDNHEETDFLKRHFLCAPPNN